MKELALFVGLIFLAGCSTHKGIINTVYDAGCDLGEVSTRGKNISIHCK